MFKPVRKAVFPVGGLGTRFLPATKAMPKEMLTVVDKPLIHHAVEEAARAGVEQFIFVTGRGKSAIEDHFDRSYELERTLEERGKLETLKDIISAIPNAGEVFYTRQQNPKGLGHAVWCARDIVGNEPFAVLLADDLIHSKVPCLGQMVDAYNKLGGNLAAVMEVPKEQTKRYGILDVESDDGKVAKAKGLVEKPDPKDAPSNLSIIGRYILQPAVFMAIENQAAGAGGEIQLTDALAATMSIIPFHGYRFEGKRYDCGDKLGFQMANLALALDRDEMKEGMLDFMREILAETPAKK